MRKTGHTVVCSRAVTSGFWHFLHVSRYFRSKHAGYVSRGWGGGRVTGSKICEVFTRTLVCRLLDRMKDQQTNLPVFTRSAHNMTRSRSFVFSNRSTWPSIFAIPCSYFTTFSANFWADDWPTFAEDNASSPKNEWMNVCIYSKSLYIWEKF